MKEAIMSTQNPLIGTTSTETVQNVSSALDAFMRLIANQDSNLYFMLLPMQDALVHAAQQAD
jgi:hypothetical protein